MKVMVFGSFDRLHDGHRALFAQAKALGEVYVVVARDASIRRLKHRDPRQPEQERLRAVEQDSSVTKAVLGHPDDFFAVVDDLRPDILLLGYDQQTFSEERIADELARRGLSAEIRRAAPFRAGELKSSKLI